VHPFWEPNAVYERYWEIINEFSSDGSKVILVDTFDLARRQVEVRESIRQHEG
jgi:hypothetical protein